MTTITRKDLEALAQRADRGEFGDVEREIKAIIEAVPPADQKELMRDLWTQTVRELVRYGFDEEDFKLIIDDIVERFKKKIN